MSNLEALQSYAKNLNLAGEIIKTGIGYWLTIPHDDIERYYLGRHRKEAEHGLNILKKMEEEAHYEQIGQERYDMPVHDQRYLDDHSNTDSEWLDWWERVA